MVWTILLTIVFTIVAVVISLNFVTPEKKLEHMVQHRYAVSDPEFRREMGVMLGPSLSPSNHVTDLQNGDEIFQAMLEAVLGAQRTITFET